MPAADGQKRSNLIMMANGRAAPVIHDTRRTFDIGSVTRPLCDGIPGMDRALGCPNPTAHKLLDMVGSPNTRRVCSAPYYAPQNPNFAGALAPSPTHADPSVHTRRSRTWGDYEGGGSHAQCSGASSIGLSWTAQRAPALPHRPNHSERVCVIGARCHATAVTTAHCPVTCSAFRTAHSEAAVVAPYGATHVRARRMERACALFPSPISPHVAAGRRPPRRKGMTRRSLNPLSSVFTAVIASVESLLRAPITTVRLRLRRAQTAQ